MTSSCPALTVQDFSLSVTPPSATALPGGVAIYTVTASSFNAFTGQINLVQSTTLPSGVSAAWSPTNQSCTVPAGGSCSATYTVTVGAGAIAADTGLVFHGTYAPVLTTRSASSTLHIPPPAPVINSISPLSGNQGQSQLPVTVTGLNFQTGAILMFNGISGSRITVSAPSVSLGGTTLTATITIPSNEPIELKDIIVINPDTQKTTLAAGFRVTTEFLIPGLATTQAADEPSLAVDPTNSMHLVVGFNVLARDQNGAFQISAKGCGWSESFNGGISWSPIPGSLKLPKSFTARGDPWMRFSPDGKLFYSCMGASSSAVGVFVGLSRTGHAADLGTANTARTTKCTKSTCISTDEPTFDILMNGSVPRLIACWIESTPSNVPGILKFSLLKVAFSDGGTKWSDPPLTISDPNTKAFACRVGTKISGALGTPASAAISWLNGGDDALYFRTSDGVTFDPIQGLAPRFDPLLKFGSTTDKVLSRAYASLVPGQESVRAIGQSRSNGISVVFARDLDPSLPLVLTFFGDSTVERFLPSAGNCTNLAGMYQIINPGITDSSTPFRYTAWSIADPTMDPTGPLFTSGADLYGASGFSDSTFPGFPRIGEYTGVACSGNLGWVSWTDLRNGKPEIWVARIPLQ